MTIQTVELAGRRFVIIAEEEFQKLSSDAQSAGSGLIAKKHAQFARVIPLKVGGTPASEILLRDRR